MRRTASRSSRALRPPGSGVPVPGAWPGSHDVDVDGEEDALALVGGDRERLGEALGEAAVDDLGHLVGPHLLRGHPVEGLGTGPVAAQPHLEEAVTAERPRLDEAAHRLAVAPQRAELDVTGVGVRVEVDHRHATVAQHVGHALGVREGDRVVAAEDDRDRTGAGDLLHRCLQHPEGALDVAGWHLHVAGVDHSQVLQAVGAQRQARPRAVVREVVGHPDRLRPESRAGSVRRAAVEGRPDHDDVGAGVRRRVVEVARGDAEERDVRAELSAVASHGPMLERYQSPSAANRSPISRWAAESGWRLSGSGRRSSSARP